MTHTFGETLVRIENVSLTFSDKPILKPTTIEVKDALRPGMAQGQIVGILCQLGIGKTQMAQHHRGSANSLDWACHPDGQRRTLSRTRVL